VTVRDANLFVCKQTLRCYEQVTATGSPDLRLLLAWNQPVHALDLLAGVESQARGEPLRAVIELLGRLPGGHGRPLLEPRSSICVSSTALSVASGSAPHRDGLQGADQRLRQVLIAAWRWR
jgi:hypothetical protein